MKIYESYKELFKDIGNDLYNSNIVSQGDIIDFQSELGYEMKKLFELDSDELNKYRDIEDYLSYLFNDSDLLFEFESEPFCHFTEKIWNYIKQRNKINFIKECKE